MVRVVQRIEDLPSTTITDTLRSVVVDSYKDSLNPPEYGLGRNESVRGRSIVINCSAYIGLLIGRPRTFHCIYIAFLLAVTSSMLQLTFRGYRLRKLVFSGAWIRLCFDAPGVFGVHHIRRFTVVASARSLAPYRLSLSHIGHLGPDCIIALVDYSGSPVSSAYHIYTGLLLTTVRLSISELHRVIR